MILLIFVYFHSDLYPFSVRFAAFFTCPLFTESATGREVNAVDSENSRNLQSDPWRLFQLDKSLSQPDHDFGKFGTGKFIFELCTLLIFHFTDTF